MADQISQMWAIADSREQKLLHELAVRAGLRWECRSCSTWNVTETRCDRCGEPRAAVVTR